MGPGPLCRRPARLIPCRIVLLRSTVETGRATPAVRQASAAAHTASIENARLRLRFSTRRRLEEAAQGRNCLARLSRACIVSEPARHTEKPGVEAKLENHEA